jgi:hypothetical protein
MAVGRLSGQWVWEILRTNYPEGVVRRALLDDFASILVSPKSRGPAKARLAKRLYAKLALLQRRGFILQEDGIIRLLGVARKLPKDEAMPIPGPVLRKKLFLAMMAEDRNPQQPDAARLHATRWDFLAAATEAGWTVLQASAALGIPRTKAREILERPPRRPSPLH